MSLPYSLVGDGEREFITVFIDGRPLVASDDHPNFLAILSAAQNTSPTDTGYVVDLFDVSAAVAQKFERLSNRVTVAHGRVFFDGDEQDDSITQQIVRFLDAGLSDYVPLVNFMEKVASNPEQHSRVQLYDWLRAHEFTITAAGDIVGYKGVHLNDDDGSLLSGALGRATVNGEQFVGQIPNEVGSIVEMPRNAVAHDPGASCSTGLHVGTFEYAEGFARGAMLKVLVNPRDVVSVPTDARGEKVRVCRYVVAEVIDAPETAPLTVETHASYDEDECDECGEYYEDCECRYGC